MTVRVALLPLGMKEEVEEELVNDETNLLSGSSNVEAEAKMQPNMQL